MHIHHRRCFLLPLSPSIATQSQWNISTNHALLSMSRLFRLARLYKHSSSHCGVRARKHSLGPCQRVKKHTDKYSRSRMLLPVPCMCPDLSRAAPPEAVGRQLRPSRKSRGLVERHRQLELAQMGLFSECKGCFGFM